MGRTYRGLILDDFQEEAVAAIDRGQSVLVAAPTGTGKTLIAEYAIDRALAHGERVVFTAPIKALSNQKFRDFTARWGPEKVGILTGDVAIRPDAPCCIMTTEIFRNCIFEGDRLAEVRACVFDEVHFIDDEERGTVWEESVIFAPPGMRFVCLSATLPNLDELAGWMSKTRGAPFAVVRSDVRAVPLEHRFFTPEAGPLDLDRLRKSARSWRPRESLRRDAGRGGPRGKGYGRQRRPLPRFQPPPRPDPDAAIGHAVNAGRLPCLYFAFARRACEALASAQTHRSLLDPGRRARALETYEGHIRQLGLEGTAPATVMRRLVACGIAFHHAGMLPTMKEVVERLFAAGHLRLLFATETFALGVNMPAASVVFDEIRKFDGVAFGFLRVRDYRQMAGRAGRRGMDEKGTVFALCSGTPEDAAACRRLVEGETEPIESRFHLSYASILNLQSRLGDRLPEVAERSFAAYRQEAGPGGMPAGELLRRRLEILRRFRYCHRDRPTPTEKGRFAMRVFGYEIQASELLAAGRLDGLDVPELAALFVALVYEPRKASWHAAPSPETLAWMRRSFEGPIEAVRVAEERLGLPTYTKAPAFHLSAAARAWAEGTPFGDLRNLCSLDAGDLIRTFRQTLQVVRQVRAGLPAAKKDLRARLQDVQEAMDRDEVDVERQLRASSENAGDS